MNYIRLRKNNLCIENISAFRLTKKYKTPFYCYSLGQLKKILILLEVHSELLNQYYVTR